MKVHQLAVCVFVIASAGLLYCQGGANGTILGTVIDNSGAVVANANVDVSNVATGITSHAVTSADGNFTVPSCSRILPGKRPGLWVPKGSG